MADYIFYTPLEVAEKLLDLLPEREYKSIIDICCGSWNLLKAARNRFPSAKFTGVDIQQSSAVECFEGADFQVQDGRDFAVEAYKSRRLYDLVLSNPPFGLLKEDNRKFASGKGDYIVPNLNNHRYENEMIQANLMIAEEDAFLIFILPSTFVEGEKNRKLRKALAEKYLIRELIRLPLETFGSRQIHSCAVIMQKSQQYHFSVTNCYEMIFNGKNFHIQKQGICSYERILNGIWTDREGVEGEDIGIYSFRGCISSNQLSETGEVVLHCSSQVNNNKWHPARRYCDDVKLLTHCRKARPGDIIVNRIGKYAGFWYLNTEDVYISDCLIVFRSEKGVNLKKCFHKNSTNGKLNVPIKGVATRYVSTSDIKALFLDELKRGK